MFGSRLKWIMKIALTLGATLLIIGLAQLGGEWTSVAHADSTLPSWCPSVPTISPCPNPTIPTFTDVPDSEWFYPWVETVACHGYVYGYGDGTYGPLDNATRGEMAVFIERAVNGPSYTPTLPAPTLGTFVDVDYSTPIWYANWVEGLYQDGMTAGCAGTIPGVDLEYCPESNHLRAEAAVFFERVINGSSFIPTLPTVGSFIDVDYSTPIWYANWVEGIYQDGVVAGCGGTVPGVDLAYCPENDITRAEVAVFMVRSLCLPMVPDTIP